MNSSNKQEPPFLLLTNDDGIDSWFLEAVVNALLPHYEVAVAAPANEMSWIGRALSRHRNVQVQRETRYSCPAWRIAGTPADCVNIAIGNLLPRQPDAVISGINIGANATVPMILSSGTVAGAIEGALRQIPSVAFSKQLPADIFQEVQAHHGRSPASVLESLEHCIRWIVQFVPNLLEPGSTPRDHMHNVNFPYPVTADTLTKKTIPGWMAMPSLFVSDNQKDYHFQYPNVAVRSESPSVITDRECLLEGHISHSLLNLNFR